MTHNTFQAVCRSAVATCWPRYRVWHPSVFAGTVSVQENQQCVRLDTPKTSQKEMLRRRMQGKILLDLGRCETCLWGCLRVHGLRNHSFAFIFHPFPYFTEIEIILHWVVHPYSQLFWPLFTLRFGNARRQGGLRCYPGYQCCVPVPWPTWEIGQKCTTVLTECRSASQPRRLLSVPAQ